MSGIEAAFFGALGRDAEQKTSQSGKSYLRLSVRVGDDEKAQWISVLCFDTRAIEVADKLVKGMRLYCEGRLELQEWQASDGTKKQSLSCMSWHCRIAQIGRQKIKRPGQKPKVSGEGGTAFYDDEIGF